MVAVNSVFEVRNAMIGQLIHIVAQVLNVLKHLLYGIHFKSAHILRLVADALQLCGYGCRTCGRHPTTERVCDVRSK